MTTIEPTRAAKERPILFSGVMVRAILEGRKTQTRRVIKDPAYFACLTGDCPHAQQAECDNWMAHNCPHGVVSNRLWVRETFRVFGGEEYAYQQHQPSVIYREGSDLLDNVSSNWKPSIFMPRWASRITLEITDLRVERVRDISEEDALAEGVAKDNGSAYLVAGLEREWAHATARGCFETLWDSLNKARGFGWITNPYVWAITFRKL